VPRQIQLPHHNTPTAKDARSSQQIRDDRKARILEPTTSRKVTTYAFKTKSKRKPRLVIDLRNTNNLFRVPQGNTHSNFHKWLRALPVTHSHLLSIDITSAYHHIALHRHIRKLFTLKHNNTTLQCTTCPFGWTASHYFLHQLTQAITQFLIHQDIPTFCYVDDFCFAIRHPRTSQGIMQFFKILGFYIKPSPTNLQHRAPKEYIGCKISMTNSQLRPSQKRIANALKALRYIYTRVNIKFNTIMRLLGTIWDVVTFAPHLRTRLPPILEQWKKYWQHASIAGYRQTANIKVTASAWQAFKLRQLYDALRHEQQWLPFNHSLQTDRIVIETDSTPTQYGIIIYTTSTITTGAAHHSFKHQDIHAAEAQAILEALRQVPPQKQLTAVQIRTDNPAAAALSKRGSTRTDLARICVKMYNEADRRNLWLEIPQKVRGAEIQWADRLSRMNVLVFE